MSLRLRPMKMSRWIISAVLAGPISLAGLGCQPPYSFVITGADDAAIRQSAIDSIVQDTTLTDDQKRQALRDLGITDENLIDVLIQSSGTGT